MNQYEFLIAEIARVTKPGRISAVHVTNIKDSKTGDMWNFPAEVVKLHQKYGFVWKDQITIWKEPLKVRMRTMVRSLMHKLIVEDSTECFTAMPDYILVFKKKGINEVPVTHPVGLKHYAGTTPILPEMSEKYGTFEELKKKYEGWQDPKTNKLSHIIWQRYASSVWDDIRIDEVLQFKDSKDEDDEKHVHPLQLDVIDRCVELWSNPGEIVLTPFMGVGSEVYSPVSMGRKAIGIELKDSYYKQAVLNLKDVKIRYEDKKQLTIDI
jgi:DNA modification methylase